MVWSKEGVVSPSLIRDNNLNRLALISLEGIDGHLTAQNNRPPWISDEAKAIHILMTEVEVYCIGILLTVLK